jgi:hypothetical protein
MKRTVLASLALIAVLAASAMLLVPQAQTDSQSTAQDYVGYETRIIQNEPTILSIDNSSMPQLLIIEQQIDGLTEGNLTINGQVYVYPDDFNFSSYQYVALNPMTGEGFVRINGNITLNMTEPSTLCHWVVAHFTGLLLDPNGTMLAPENYTSTSTFRLSGTGMLSDVDGFGVGVSSFVPPNYTTQAIHQFGFIKGWPDMAESTGSNSTSP